MHRRAFLGACVVGGAALARGKLPAGVTETSVVVPEPTVLKSVNHMQIFSHGGFAAPLYNDLILPPTGSPVRRLERPETL